MRLLDKDAILQEDFSDEFWEPVDYSSFRALISIYPEVDIKTEVAREIFAEIDEILFDYENVIREEYKNAIETRFAELKNKYIGGAGE